MALREVHGVSGDAPRKRILDFDGVKVAFDLTGQTLRAVSLPKRVAPSFGAATLRKILREAARYHVGFDSAPEFTRRVWERMMQIPPGQTMSYGALAADLGNPGAARAVGAACAANPLPLVVPCHRVVAADGGLGGFSLGLGWKRRLLDIEREASDTDFPRFALRVRR